MSIQTSSSASLMLSFLALSPEQRNLVTRCIHNYSQQGTTLTDRIQQTIYTCMEALRSLFNRSDWQQAESALRDKTLSLVPSFCQQLCGKSPFERVSNQILPTLIRLNQCSTRLPQQAEQFVAKRCNVDTINTVVSSWVNKQQQAFLDQSQKTLEREITRIWSSALEQIIQNIWQQKGHILPGML